MTARLLAPATWPEATRKDALITELHRRTRIPPNADEIDWDRVVDVLARDGHVVLHGSWGGRRYCEVRPDVRRYGEIYERLHRLLGDTLGYRAWDVMNTELGGARLRMFRREFVRIQIVRSRPSRPARWRMRTGSYRFFGHGG